jgi:hypothetical protein
MLWFGNFEGGDGMSDPNPAATTRTSAGSRYLFLFLIGLVVGAVGVVMAMRTLDARKTWEDRWHDASMQVMNAHAESLKRNVQQNRCAATDTLPHLQALRVVANDAEPAFPDLSDDARFVQHASKLRAEVDAALASPPLNCQGVGVAAAKIGEACKACHQDFRG